MGTTYLVITVLLTVMLVYSGLGKLRRDPRMVGVIHDVVGVPMKYLPALAACEFAGALGLMLGIWWPAIALAAGIGLIMYFVAAIVSHLRVGDFKGIGPAAFFLTMAVGALVTRILSYKTTHLGGW